MCSFTNKQFDLLKSHLLDGDVCVFPTDTVVGIGCIAYKTNTRQVNAEGINKIFEIKDRDKSKKLPWLIGDYSWAERYAADMPFTLEPFARRYWPGGTTLVVAANDSVNSLFCTNTNFAHNSIGGCSKKPLCTLALRVPKSNLLLNLLRQIDVPIACTSANVSGEPAVANISDVSSQILDHADFVFNYAQKNKTSTNKPSGEPSKIFDCTTQDFKRLR